MKSFLHAMREKFPAEAMLAAAVLSLFLSLCLMSNAIAAEPRGAATPSYLLEDTKRLPVGKGADSGHGRGGGSFHNALERAYRDNPRLRAARAEFKGVSETLAQALSGWRPDLSAELGMTYIKTDSGAGGFSNFSGVQDNGNMSKDAALNLSQPVYRGGRTVAAVSAARNIIGAQRALLRELEQEILLAAATAYMDVLRDQSLLELSVNNRHVVASQLEATRDRFDVGELTRTDVSQAQARLAQAEAGIVAARGRLRTSRAAYQRVVGAFPAKEKLDYPENLPEVPQEIEALLLEVETSNPAVIASRKRSAAAEDDVDGFFGELLPEVNINGSLGYSEDPQPGFLQEEGIGTLSLVASIPLYKSGAARSRIRQSKHTANQRYLEILVARRAAREEAISNWENLRAATAEILFRRAQVEASEIAQEGVHQEAGLGARTVLDALDADQEALDAHVALVSSRRDEIVAQMALAATLGRLSPETLGFSAETAALEEPGQSADGGPLGLGIGIEEGNRGQ